MNEPYPNKGKLGAAIKHFKVAYCRGETNEWERYWKEFADQAFADLMALEFENAELKIENKKLKNKIKKTSKDHDKCGGKDD